VSTSTTVDPSDCDSGVAVCDGVKDGVPDVVGLDDCVGDTDLLVVTVPLTVRELLCDDVAKGVGVTLGESLAVVVGEGVAEAVPGGVAGGEGVPDCVPPGIVPDAVAVLVGEIEGEVDGDRDREGETLGVRVGVAAPVGVLLGDAAVPVRDKTW